MKKLQNLRAHEAKKSNNDIKEIKRGITELRGLGLNVMADLAELSLQLERELRS